MDYLNLKTVNCKNCYKCLRHCPVKSISFEDRYARIMNDGCILCGNCFVVCPQNAKEIRDDTERAEALIQSGAEVFVSLAPSFAAKYRNEATGQGHTLSSMTEALKKLGFAGVEETALGATMVKRRYDQMIQEGSGEAIISSCCHSVNQLIQKYYPEVLPFLAPVLSPMLAHCMDIKRRHGDAKTVFIGPCVSKKAEAELYAGFADCVLTFEELSLWMTKKRIVLEAVEEETNGQGLARFFPVSGGILKSMEKPRADYAYVSVDGIENCVAAVEDIARGKLKRCFVEMSACAGSCIGGPAMGREKTGERKLTPVSSFAAIARYAGEKDFETETYSAEALRKDLAPSGRSRVHVGEQAVLETLRKLGKTKPEQELNCGTCGYNTCRDKARAVLEGKAALYMCLPYLVEKAESFSDTIIENAPNGIIALNETLEVQQINAAACKLFNISPADILGDQVVRLLDPVPFLEALQEGKNTYNKRLYLPDYKLHIEETIIFDKNYRIIIGIMRDISGEEQRREFKKEFTRKAIELTDRVIEKQMLSVQEIASLLGETTAETKIALTKLKESVLQEDR
ncbi:MAG: PAS domain-containing protein [Treponema sp.]|jgi:iron only hydrogenase large subunit-like protein/uncharacterized Fe-S cluster-containing protein|nr:PAS domain-containing protein [Treponema sp.]